MPETRPVTEQLTRNLRASLPDGALCITDLPRIPLRLWLLDAALLADRPLSHEVAARVMAAPAYWAFCWASGQALAAKILAEPERVRGRKVLDLGAGSGVVAIACAMAGAARVWACDTDPYAQAAIAANAELNGVNVERVASLDEAPAVDVLLAADILYDPDNRPQVAGLTERAAGVLIADSRVREVPAPGFVLLGEAQARTWPDLGELAQYNLVNFYGFQVS
ncbi:50S ribosomal protein L11 methyltransferase [Simiduia sp. 21SJ11W-1]|uniref:class I SAM-dependent methyltransferase n=1 Tax=Simiduia sp. 21SJ11W-1 TaxID=2909669 RepID=UPI0020A0CBEA|nr:50S ribosomal protein L11 methyltransferase [Simiduia sp. 21SJ11W-1]UTA47297.1 50S ribosomal protein L11 methyltransferase [Simiduia sp. 21SJ11W-1]